MSAFNPLDMVTLDAWRDNLTKRLTGRLPEGTVVEFVATSRPGHTRYGLLKRHLVIHLGDKRIKINLKFPESLDMVMDRVLEAIK